MVMSIVRMLIAFGVWLPPVGGAVFHEAIDSAAVLMPCEPSLAASGATTAQKATDSRHRHVIPPIGEDSASSGLSGARV